MLGPFATASRFTLSFTNCRYCRHCRTPPVHRCPRRRQQRQRVTEGTAMAPWNGPNKQIYHVTSWFLSFLDPQSVHYIPVHNYVYLICMPKLFSQLLLHYRVCCISISYPDVTCAIFACIRATTM